MNMLYTALFLTGGTGLIILGVWLTIKEMATWSKWYNDKWTIGNVQGLGAGCTGIGVILILETLLG